MMKEDFQIFWNKVKIAGLRAYKFWVGLNRRWKISIIVTLISWTIYFTSHLSWWKVLILNAIIIYGVFGTRKKKQGVDK